MIEEKSQKRLERQECVTDGQVCSQAIAYSPSYHGNVDSKTKFSSGNYFLEILLANEPYVKQCECSKDTHKITYFERHGREEEKGKRRKINRTKIIAKTLRSYRKDLSFRWGE